MTLPTAYGYLSRPYGCTPRQEERWRQRIVHLAEAEGLTLAGVFVDDRATRPDGYAAMLEALRRRDVQYVLTPSLEHLAHIPRLAGWGRGAIARHLGAVVLSASDSASETRLPRRSRCGRAPDL